VLQEMRAVGPDATAAQSHPSRRGIPRTDR
jgi:hypothetical protein